MITTTTPRKLYSYVSRLVWSLSGGCFALLLLNNTNYLQYGQNSIPYAPLFLLVFLLACAGFLVVAFAIKHIHLPTLLPSRLAEVARLYITACFVVIHATYLYNRGLVDTLAENELLCALVAIGSLYATWIITGLLMRISYRFVQFLNLNIFEKRLIIIYTSVSITLIACVNFLTDIFYQTDKVFSLDTGHQLAVDILNNTYTSYTGVRHIGESVMTAPIGVVTKSFESLLWFIPNGEHLIALACFNILIAFSSIMLVRMMHLKKRLHIILFHCLYLLSFPVQLYSTMFEQYVPSVFFIILFIFLIWATESKRPALNYAALSPKYLQFAKVSSLVASGMGILTSFFMGLLLLSRSLSQSVKNIALFAVCLLLFVLMTGQLITILFGHQEYTALRTFMDLSYLERAMIYSHFVFNTITNITAEFTAAAFSNGYGVVDSTKTLSHFSVPGILLLVVSLGGLTIGMRKKQILHFASFLWIILSSIVLIGFGWGATNNESTLYTYYFSFAFVVGLFTALIWLVNIANKHWQKYSYIFTSLLIAIVASVSLSSAYLRIDIIKYGTIHYPVNAREFIKHAVKPH